MIAVAPEGTPPQRIGEQNSKQLPAPPCLAEALRRESIVQRRFSGSGCELPFMPVSTESFFPAFFSSGQDLFQTWQPGPESPASR